MMLRSLVKKFKSHSINEDVPIDGQQPPNTNVEAINVLSLEQTQLSEGVSTAVASDINDSPQAPSVLVSSASVINKDGSMNRYDTMAARQNYQGGAMARHHHLRSSMGCGCNGGSTTVSSIATRLRSSVMPTTTPDQERTAHGGYHRHCSNQCQQHRRSSGVGTRYSHGQGASSKADADVNNVVLDEDCNKDSGTESDDEELEQIETNSTHSVPVSQTSDYYASQQSLSINSCRSSHCSSPILGLSDQECNSWESIGSESGIGSVRTVGSRQHCQHHAKQHHNNCRAFSGMVGNMPAPFQLPKIDNTKMITAASSIQAPPEFSTMSEELPQHHYHTRQQFQRLTQQIQISMKNGLTTTNDDDDELEDLEETASLNGLSKQPTAFVPVRRSQNATPTAVQQQTTTIAANQSPEGAGSSSLDELEEVNFGLQRNIPRSRTACGTTSEKRKWSQTRQDCKSKPSSNGTDGLGFGSGSIGVTTIDSNGDVEKKRPILHAARKTPIKLLFSLDCSNNNNGNENGDEQKLMARSSSRCQIHNQQLPQGNVSPPVGNVAKKLRSMRKKCTKSACSCDFEEKGASAKEKHGQTIGEDDDDEEDDEDMNRAAKRPSLDFNKMRGKLVSLGATGGGNKKTKRTNSLINCSKTKLKTIGGRREGYQLRSTHRRCCLFRPLEPPSTSGTMADEQQILDQACSSTWFPSQSQESTQQSWNQSISNGTYYFGSNASHD